LPTNEDPRCKGIKVSLHNNQEPKINTVEFNDT